MTTVEELLSRLVQLENEVVQTQQRQAGAEKLLIAAEKQIHQLSSAGSASSSSSITGVADTRTLGEP